MLLPYSIPGFSDPFSSLSHLSGAVIFFGLSYSLLKKGCGDFWKTVTLAIFSFSAVFLLTMSGVYHLLTPDTIGREVLRRIDHSAIFILIIGTMTPVHQILFRGFMRWGWLILLWITGISALILKAVFFTICPEWLGLTMFLSLGWLGAVSGGIIWYWKNFSYIKYLVGGGLAYTIGAIIEFIQHPVLLNGVLGSHELFHIAVLVGLSLHWKFIATIADQTLLQTMTIRMQKNLNHKIKK